MHALRLVPPLAITVAVAVCACDSQSDRFTIAPGVSIPSSSQWAEELRSAEAARLYTQQHRQLIEMHRSHRTPPAHAVVRSYDPTSGLAYVDVNNYPEYNMPLLQVWRFDGKRWSDVR